MIGLIGKIKELLAVEHHIHSRERWFGKSADQSGNDWAVEAGLTPFRAISGNGAFGIDADDEAKVLGTDDTPVIAGMINFDFHRLLIDEFSSTTAYFLRVVYGTGTMADAEAAGQYTDIMAKQESKDGRGDVFAILMPRLDKFTKVWIRAKNATDNATIDFFVGLHEYKD